jgi:hypothetical protein
MQGTVIYLQRIGEGTFALLPACFREPKKVSKTTDLNGAESPRWGFPHTSDLTVIVNFSFLRQSATHDSIPHYFSKAITNIPKPVGNFFRKLRGA